MTTTNQETKFVLNNGAMLVDVRLRSGGGFVVLAKNGDEYVTWQASKDDEYERDGYNVITLDCYWGHYHRNDVVAAAHDFVNRVAGV